jgi:hypothetical protein
LLENRCGVGVRQSLGFVHQHSQCHRLRSHLHRRRREGIGGLQRVTPLHSLVALRTSADRNAKAPHPRAAHNLFLVLRLHPFDRQRPTAGRALRWRRYGDLFVYTIRDRPPVVRAMGRTRLTPGSSGLTLGKTTGERGGLASGGTLRSFQFLAQPLDFLLQPLALPLQPLVLFLQLLVSSAGLVAFLPRKA